MIYYVAFDWGVAIYDLLYIVNAIHGGSVSATLHNTNCRRLYATMIREIAKVCGESNIAYPRLAPPPPPPSLTTAFIFIQYYILSISRAIYTCPSRFPFNYYFHLYESIYLHHYELKVMSPRC